MDANDQGFEHDEITVDIIYFGHHWGGVLWEFDNCIFPISTSLTCQISISFMSVEVKTVRLVPRVFNQMRNGFALLIVF